MSEGVTKGVVSPVQEEISEKGNSSAQAIQQENIQGKNTAGLKKKILEEELEEGKILKIINVRGSQEEVAGQQYWGTQQYDTIKDKERSSTSIEDLRQSSSTRRKEEIKIAEDRMDSPGGEDFFAALAQLMEDEEIVDNVDLNAIDEARASFLLDEEIQNNT